MSGTTSSSLMNAPGGMGGTVPSSLSTARDGMAGGLPWPSSSFIRGGGGAGAARSTAFRPSGDRATHSAASSAVTKLPRVTSLLSRLTFAW
eukprot:scaffold17331_cov66-Phaeocystis_antarctica.AAC.3